jgi:hypothetical protein
MASVPHPWAWLFCDGPPDAETTMSLGPAFQRMPQVPALDAAA